MCVGTSSPISAASGGREALPDHEFINVPAEQCSVRRTGFGERFVRYRGKDYLLMGLYLVPQLGERPEFFFVLRSIYGGGPARTPLPSGRRRVRIRSIVGRRLFPQGVFMAALIALLALLGNGPKSPGGATSGISGDCKSILGTLADDSQNLDIWSGRSDLNRRPPEPHSGALPSCATARRSGSL